MTKCKVVVQQHKQVHTAGVYLCGAATDVHELCFVLFIHERRRRRREVSDGQA